MRYLRFVWFAALAMQLTSCIIDKTNTTPPLVQNNYSKINPSKRQRPLYNKIILNRIQDSEGNEVETKNYSVVNKKSQPSGDVDDIMYLNSKLKQIEDGTIKVNKSAPVKVQAKPQKSTDQSLTTQPLPAQIVSKKEDEVATPSTNSTPPALSKTPDKTLEQQIAQNNDVEIASNANDYIIKPSSVFDMKQPSSEPQPAEPFSNANSNAENEIVQTPKSLVPIPAKTAVSVSTSNAESKKKLLEDKKFLSDTKLDKPVIATKTNKPQKKIVSIIEDDGIVLDEATAKDLGLKQGGTNMKKSISKSNDIANEEVSLSKSAPVAGVIANRVAKANAPKSKRVVVPMSEGKIESLKQKAPYTILTEDDILGTYSVQIGAYETEEEAIEVANNVSKINDIFIQPVVVSGTDYYRIKTGPFTTKKQADSCLYNLIKNGYYDIYVVQN